MEERPNPDETVPERGPDRNYCSYPASGDEGHHMVTITVPDAKLIRMIERCALCGWIDGAGLDRWAEQAYKEQMEKRAQRIAMAAESEPFSFHQSSGEDLKLSEVLGQALGAASMCWESPEKAGVFDSTRAARVYAALEAEVLRFQQLNERGWADLAYELYALACNSQPLIMTTAERRDEWQAAFERLRDRFHELLPGLMDRAKRELVEDGGGHRGPAGEPAAVPGSDPGPIRSGDGLAE